MCRAFVFLFYGSAIKHAIFKQKAILRMAFSISALYSSVIRALRDPDPCL